MSGRLYFSSLIIGILGFSSTPALADVPQRHLVQECERLLNISIKAPIRAKFSLEKTAKIALLEKELNLAETVEAKLSTLNLLYALNPDNIGYVLYLGGLHRTRNENELANFYLLRAVELGSINRVALLNLQQSFRLLGEQQKVAGLEKILERYQLNAEKPESARKAKIKKLLFEEKPAEALKEVDLWLTSFPANVSALKSRVWILLTLKRFSEALPNLSLLESLEKKEFDARLTLAAGYLANSDFDKAQRYFPGTLYALNSLMVSNQLDKKRWTDAVNDYSSRQ